MIASKRSASAIWLTNWRRSMDHEDLQQKIEELEVVTKALDDKSMPFGDLRSAAETVREKTKQLRMSLTNCQPSALRDIAFQTAIDSVRGVITALKARAASIEKATLSERDVDLEIGDYF